MNDDVRNEITFHFLITRALLKWKIERVWYVENKLLFIISIIFIADDNILRNLFPSQDSHEFHFIF